jgi:hypothetical protein
MTTEDGIRAREQTEQAVPTTAEVNRPRLPWAANRGSGSVILNQALDSRGKLFRWGDIVDTYPLPARIRRIRVLEREHRRRRETFERVITTLRNDPFGLKTFGILSASDGPTVRIVLIGTNPRDKNAFLQYLVETSTEGAGVTKAKTVLHLGDCEVGYEKDFERALVDAGYTGSPLFNNRVT